MTSLSLQLQEKHYQSSQGPLPFTPKDLTTEEIIQLLHDIKPYLQSIREKKTNERLDNKISDDDDKIPEKKSKKRQADGNLPDEGLPPLKKAATLDILVLTKRSNLDAKEPLSLETAAPSMTITAMAKPSVETQPRKSVTWAPEGQLEQIRLFKPASYEETNIFEYVLYEESIADEWAEWYGPQD